MVSVTNRGSQPVWQLSAVMDSANPWFDHREFYFGKIDPGQTRSWSQRVQLHDGYAGELAPVELTFRTPDEDKVLKVEHLVRSEPRPLPRFAYSLVLHDDGTGDSEGNGDGVAEAGEVIDLEIIVKNIGEGDSAEAFARVKNKSGRALDLSKGGIAVGEPRTADGQPCVADSDGCKRVLKPGESFSGRVTFELRDPPDEGAVTAPGTWDLELQVGDNARYDYTTIQRGGFYDYYDLSESLHLAQGQPLDGAQRLPPVIEVTRAPGLEVDGPDTVVSGVVRDDEGIRDVMIFQGEEKVFYRGGDGETTVMPFAVDPRLEPGTNLVYVLARDERGLVATLPIDVWYRPPVATASGSAPPSDGTLTE